jgi:site-specific recombinase XerD
MFMMVNNTVKQLLMETIAKIEGAYAPSTIRAYRANFERFITFSENHNQSALPADSQIVTTYIKKLSDGRLKSASIRIAIASISAIHRLNQFDDPTTHPDVKIEIRRMHRTLGRDSKQAVGINIKTLEEMLKSTDKSIIGLRDRALILIAYSGMCRRSELIALRLEDITYDNENAMKIKLRRSKTDQDGLGRWLHINNEAQKAIKDWLDASEIVSGKLFRGVRKGNQLSGGLNSSQINRIYKKLARRARISADLIKNISGHSMRVGAAQDLLITGASFPVIMQRGRWGKTDTVMRYLKNSYIE